MGVKSATKRGYEVATENDSINFTYPGSETRRGRVGKGVAQTLDCACNQGVIVKDVQIKSKQRRQIRISSTLDTCEGGGRETKILENFRIRKLTPKECFRLQGLKDEDIKLINSNSQSYRIAGNGIEVNTLRSIIRSLYKPTNPKGSLF